MAGASAALCRRARLGRRGVAVVLVDRLAASTGIAGVADVAGEPERQDGDVVALRIGQTAGVAFQ